ncbi:MAG: 3D domain-containing protein [Lachnospiraceae bacterium]|nr:3D domain-containing protein [Lachnospiraceae bacterium]
MKEGRVEMKKRPDIRTVIGSVVLFLVAAAICVFGYRVIVKAKELPGKLSSVSIAADNLDQHVRDVTPFRKVSYDTMKYGYMEDMMVLRMNTIDEYYESEQMEEIRAVNNLTAMSEKTMDKIAYEKAREEQEAINQKKRDAAIAAELAKQAKQRADAQRLANAQYSYAADSGSNSDTASRGGKKGEPVYAATTGQSLGKFVITAYCTCRICCGVYSGNNRTASGTIPTSNRTIAVDTNVIPFGTRVVINGQVYVAEDRGGAIKGNRIDMFFMTHREALQWGRKTIEVYLAK